MSKTIDTLIQDIKDVMMAGNAPAIDSPEMIQFGGNIIQAVHKQLAGREQSNDRIADKKIYASEVGTRCKRKIHYKMHASITPPAALLPHNKIKFGYGDMLEQYLLLLATVAGHKVEGQQDRVEIPVGSDGWRVTGRIDCLIDGEVVDVKSCSSMTYQKIVEGKLIDDDAFGYLGQLDTYCKYYGKTRGFFFCIDKVTGNIALAEYDSNPVAWEQEAQASIAAATAVSVGAVARLADVPEGSSGNRKLCTECSYCDFKKHCWPELRAFAYSNGPMFLTEVARMPKVPEIVLT